MGIFQPKKRSYSALYLACSMAPPSVLVIYWHEEIVVTRRDILFQFMKKNTAGHRNNDLHISRSIRTI